MRQRLLLLLFMVSMLSIRPMCAQIVLQYDKDQGKVIVKNDQVVVDGVTYKFFLGTCYLENFGMTEQPYKISIWEAHLEAISYDDEIATDVALKRRFIANSDKVVYNKDESPISISCNELSVEYNSKNVIFPVTKYATDMFKGKTKLKSIILYEGMTSIPDDYFNGDTNLTSFIIPESVTYIGSHAFEGCSGLTSITIPNSVTSIGGSAFDGCSRLTSVTIPGSVTSIGDGSFRNSGLTSVTIPNSVTSIGEYNQEIKGKTNVEIIPVIA